jgi:hypothetical protein
MRLRTVAIATATLVIGLPAIARGQVLRVGSYHGVVGQFRTIQSAIDAAKPGDWVLVGPGDYKTSSTRTPAGATSTPAAVLITTPGLYLRGMSRGGVVVDATKPGSPRCSSNPSDQNLGPSGSSGPLGLNGVLVWKANDVWVQNLTTCNFLTGSGDAGNGIWWNGGDGSGVIGGHGYLGSYLSATSTFFTNGGQIAGGYGIFSSNWSGGTWEHDYASNMNDSGFYIGACQQQCDQTVNDVWAEYNALGYSGSNSGGQLLVENSQFDNNEDGFDTNSQNGDNPPPQNGACPNGGISPITHTNSCWVFMDNYVHDNNNPDVPAVGFASAGPVGTGMSVSGGRNDTIMHNRFVNNGAWGTIFVPFPDNGPPCTGGVTTFPGIGCLYDESGDALLNNTYTNNGFFGNPTNGDFAQVNLLTGPTDCYSGNTDTGGSLSSSPAGAEQTYPVCNGASTGPDLNVLFLDEVACDSQIALVGGPVPCLPTDHYPRSTGPVMHPLPAGLQSMPNPCSGVPANPWCGGEVTRVKACVARSFRVPLTLAARERFESVTVTVRGHSRKFKARGHSARVLVGLGTRSRARVHFLELIRVRAHRERISFWRIYHAC